MYSYGFFNTNSDRSSQMGYIILFADINDNRNIIEFCSTNSRSILRSALGAETFGMAESCDDAIVIQHGLTEILKKRPIINNITDNEIVFNVVIGNASKKERRPMIYITAAWEAFNEGFVNDVM